MPDISMCTNQECPESHTCYRNEKSGTTPTPGYQTYMTPPKIYPDCEYYYTQQTPAIKNKGDKDGK